MLDFSDIYDSAKNSVKVPYENSLNGTVILYLNNLYNYFALISYAKNETKLSELSDAIEQKKPIEKFILENVLTTEFETYYHISEKSLKFLLNEINSVDFSFDYKDNDYSVYKYLKKLSSNMTIDSSKISKEDYLKNILSLMTYKNLESLSVLVATSIDYEEFNKLIAEEIKSRKEKEKATFEFEKWNEDVVLTEVLSEYITKQKKSFSKSLNTLKEKTDKTIKDLTKTIDDLKVEKINLKSGKNFIEGFSKFSTIWKKALTKEKSAIEAEFEELKKLLDGDINIDKNDSMCCFINMILYAYSITSKKETYKKYSDEMTSKTVITNGVAESKKSIVNTISLLYDFASKTKNPYSDMITDDTSYGTKQEAALKLADLVTEDIDELYSELYTFIYGYKNENGTYTKGLYDQLQIIADMLYNICKPISSNYTFDIFNVFNEMINSIVEGVKKEVINFIDKKVLTTDFISIGGNKYSISDVYYYMKMLYAMNKYLNTNEENFKTEAFEIFSKTAGIFSSEIKSSGYGTFYEYEGSELDGFDIPTPIISSDIITYSIIKYCIEKYKKEKDIDVYVIDSETILTVFEELEETEINKILAVVYNLTSMSKETSITKLIGTKVLVNHLTKEQLRIKLNSYFNVLSETRKTILDNNEVYADSFLSLYSKLMPSLTYITNCLGVDLDEILESIIISIEAIFNIFLDFVIELLVNLTVKIQDNTTKIEIELLKMNYYYLTQSLPMIIDYIFKNLSTFKETCIVSSTKNDTSSETDGKYYTDDEVNSDEYYAADYETKYDDVYDEIDNKTVIVKIISDDGDEELYYSNNVEKITNKDGSVSYSFDEGSKLIKVNEINLDKSIAKDENSEYNVLYILAETIKKYKTDFNKILLEISKKLDNNKKNSEEMFTINQKSAINIKGSYEYEVVYDFEFDSIEYLSKIINITETLNTSSDGVAEKLYENIVYKFL